MSQLSAVFLRLALYNHESSQKPSASQFHADDGKVLALGSSGQPCSGQHEDIYYPGRLWWPRCPLQPWYNMPRSW